MATILTIYGLLGICLALSLIKSNDKTKKAFKIAGKALLKSAPSILTVLGIVGLTLGILTPENISRLVGAEAGFTATIIAAVIGAITLIPSLVAFPLAGSLLRSGATVMTISAFITTLVMVGIVTAPMEIKALGKKFTLLRNGLGFIAALAIAGIMGGGFILDIIKKFKFPIIIAFVFIGLVIWIPDTARRSSLVTMDYLKEMILIMPPVFILMGLMEAWIPKDKIQKWLGGGSGIKGAALSFALGTLPTGPLYVAFPMAGSLLRKGARISNMVIFIGSWAALKIPQLMVEIKFLGIAFTSLRFVLTLSALVLVGLLMEFLLRIKPDKTWLENTDED